MVTDAHTDIYIYVLWFFSFLRRINFLSTLTTVQRSQASRKQTYGYTKKDKSLKFEVKLGGVVSAAADTNFSSL